MSKGKYIPSKKNQQRAAFALTTLRKYKDLTGGKGASREEIIADLLCDLLHYCIQRKLSFEDCLHSAQEHMKVERNGDE